MRFRPPHRMAQYIVEPSESDTADVSSLAVFLRRVPGGPTLVLVDTAALIWLAACEEVDVPHAVAHAVGEPVGDIREHVEAFLDTLLSQGLLEPVEAHPASQGWQS